MSVLDPGQAVPDEQLVRACGQEASALCEAVLDVTNSEWLARSADWLVARPLKIGLIVLLAWAGNKLLRKSIKRFVQRVENPEVRERLRRFRARTPGVSLLDTGSVPSSRAVARARTLGVVLRGLTSAVIYTFAIVLVLGEIGVNLGPLIAGAGIAGIAFGFGAQSLVKDFLSGIFILVEDQYGVGDVVDLGDAVGTVENVSLRTTRVRSVEGTVWHVPNGQIARVGNKSQQWARAVLDVSVAYDTDLERASDVVQRVADTVYEDPDWRPLIQEPPEVWGVEHLGADGIAIRLVLKTEPGEQFRVARRIRAAIKEAFDAEGIEIPFPQRTIWVRQEGGTFALPPEQLAQEANEASSSKTSSP